jgi:hypothetical protein
MKIYSVTVDKKPEWCMYCPVKLSNIQCGTPKETPPDQDKWSHGGKAPDERCLLIEKG